MNNLRLRKVLQIKTKVVWWFLAIFILSFIVRAMFLIFVFGVETPLRGDEPDYNRVAVHFQSGNFWNAFPEGPSSYRAPFLPLQLSVLYSVMGIDTGLGRWCMVIISSLVAPMLYLVGMRFQQKQVIAMLAGAVWALYPPSIFMSCWLLTETNAALLMVIGLGCFLWTAQSKAPWPALITGIIWGLWTLNRPQLLFLPFALLVSQAVLRRRTTWHWAWNRWLICLLAVAVTMSPWIVRNYIIHGVFIPVTTQGGLTLAIANGSLNNPIVQKGGYYKNPKLYALVRNAPESEWNKIGMEFSFRHLRENAHLLPKAVLHRAINFWTFRPNPYKPHLTRNDWIMLFVWLPILLFFLVSFFKWPWQNDWPALVMIFYAFIFALPFAGFPRFRFPVDPLIIMRAIVGLWGTIGWILNRKTV